MGTSKGYIAPTKVQWTNTKRAVTRMMNGSIDSGIGDVINSLGKALEIDHKDNSAIVNVSKLLLGFPYLANHSGINNALIEYKRSDLIGKSSKEIWDELLKEYTSNVNTFEDSIASDALTSAIRNLKIDDVDVLLKTDSVILLKELLSCYIYLSFECRYSEKIGKKKSPAETKRILEEIEKYIKSLVYDKLNLDDLLKIDFTDFDNCTYIDETLSKTYKIMQEVYGG